MDYLHWIFLALYMTLAVAAMVTILLDNRQPAKTMAWVLVLMFLPVVGIILYFFFGQNVRKERAISQHSLDQLSRRSMLESHAQASLKIPPLYQRLVHLFDIFANNLQLLYGDYLISSSETPDFIGTSLRFGSDELKTWEDIIVFFDRLGGQ